MNYIQTQKFSDVYVSCKTMMPFNRNTITALNVLVYMMKAKTEISFYAKSSLWYENILWINILWRFNSSGCAFSICSSRLD